MANKYTRPFITLGLSLLYDKLKDWLLEDKEPVIKPKPSKPIAFERVPEDVAIAKEVKEEKPDNVTPLPKEKDTEALRFGKGTGLLIKPAEHGGIVVLIPGQYGEPSKVSLEGPRGILELIYTGMANPHQGVKRSHWRYRGADPSQLNKRLGRVGKVFLNVDGFKLVVPNPLDKRNE
jgi:hypothetical protein